jgi:aspartate racemase
MGPEATAELYFRLIKTFQKDFGCFNDSDFPEIIIYNLPIPDVVSSSDNSKAVEDSLYYGIKKLKATGVDFIAIPCNTVSIFINSLRKKSGMKIISLVEETIKEIEYFGFKKIGLVSTENTINKKLFNKNPEKIEIISPNELEKKELTRMIINILKGEKNPNDKKILKKIIKKLLRQGAERVILGCTELPLLLIDETSTIDTIDVLVRSVIKEAKILE